MSEVPNKESWQPVVFASVVALVVGSITIAAIFQYENVDDMLKIWAGLSGLVGILIGAGAGYFPTTVSVKAAKAEAEQARKSAEMAVRKEQDARLELQFWTRATARLAGEVEQKRWEAIVSDFPDLKSLRRT
jgi:hypothetical protein